MELGKYWVEWQTRRGDETSWTKVYFSTEHQARAFRRRVPRTQLGWWIQWN